MTTTATLGSFASWSDLLSRFPRSRYHILTHQGHGRAVYQGRRGALHEFDCTGCQERVWVIANDQEGVTP